MGRLDHYAILTTGKISGAAQLAIQAINQEHRTAGLFMVELFTWERITEMLRQYPEIERQFYGGLRPEEVATVNSKLDFIAKQTESITATSETSEIDALIDDARTHITPANAQIAVLLLNRIQRAKGGALSDWHRFRVTTNLGVASLMLGKGTDAARYFLEAKPLRPNDQLAVENEVLAYHLLSQVEKTHEQAVAGLARFPNSTRLRSLWIQSAPVSEKYVELLEATPAHVRKDAEVASALSRRAIAAGLIEPGIQHAKDSAGDKPKWSQAHLLLAQAYFGRIAIAERTIQPLKAEERNACLASSRESADEAIALAEAEGMSFVKAEALALKSQIALFEGHLDEADHFARESFAADPTLVTGRLVMAEISFSAGNADEAIRILEEAYAKGDSAANVNFMLGGALMARGSDKDLDRAFKVFSTAKLTNLARELIDPLTIGAVSPGLACCLSISYSICGGAARRVFAIQLVRGSPDWSSALISLPKSHSTQRIESMAPSIKRYDANLPTMICANRLAPAALFAIGCAGLPAVRTVQSQTYCKQTSSPAATHRLLRSWRGGDERISPSHSPTGSGRITHHSETIPVQKSPSGTRTPFPRSLQDSWWETQSVENQSVRHKTSSCLGGAPGLQPGFTA